MGRTLSDAERSRKRNLLSVTEPAPGQGWSMDLHHKIRAARTAARLSQREVARLLGVSNSAVAQWELGETKPTYSNLVALAAVTHADAASLIGLPSEGNNEDTELSILISHWQKVPADRRPLILRMIMTAVDAEAPERPAGSVGLRTPPKRDNAA